MPGFEPYLNTWQYTSTPQEQAQGGVQQLPTSRTGFSQLAEAPVASLPTQRTGLTSLLSSGNSMMGAAGKLIPSLGSKLKGATPWGAAGAGAGILGNAIGGKAGGVLSGAGGGAATGAMLGSIIPGVGTAVGGIIGGIGGALKGIFGRKKTEPQKATDLAAKNPAYVPDFDKYVYGGKAPSGGTVNYATQAQPTANGARTPAGESGQSYGRGWYTPRG